VSQCCRVINLALLACHTHPFSGGYIRVVLVSYGSEAVHMEDPTVGHTDSLPGHMARERLQSHILLRFVNADLK
jgi:hypothetical protein